MIAGDAQNRQIEREKGSPKVLIGLRAVVLNQIACYNGEIRTPGVASIMFEHRSKR